MGRKRPGRPARPMERKQRNRMMVNLTDAEYEALVQAAGDEPLGTYVRDVLLRHLRRKRGRR